jgi:APA family basic amino acid/polyamine antiporter
MSFLAFGIMSIFRPILKDKEFNLEKRLRLFEATMAGVGFILGAGIYVLIGAVAQFSGSAIWLSFLLAGFAALTAGFSYAELSSMFPVSESEYVYADKGLGKSFGFFAYISVILALTIGISGVSLGFASYFAELTGITNLFFIAVGVITFFALLNWYSVKYAARVTFVCTIFSIIGLLSIVALAFFTGGTTSTNYLVMPEGLLGVIKGASLIFFAYLGFEGVVKIADETKNARKNIPLAIIFSIVISTIIYLAVAIAAVSVLPWNELAVSQAPLADVAAAVLGSKAFVILAIIALLSTANTILMGILSSSRGFYGLGQIFTKFKAIAKVGKRNTPTRAILITSLIAIIFLFFEDISTIVGFTNFLIFTTFTIINISVIRLRYTRPELKRKFKMPLNIGKLPLFSVLGILISVFLAFNLELLHIISGIIASLVIFFIYYLLYMKTKSTTA